MAIFLLWTACSFLIPLEQDKLRIGMILAGLMLFGSVYAPGEGLLAFLPTTPRVSLYT